MPWTNRHRSELLRLAEAGELDRDQLDGALRHAPLHPSSDEWRSLLDRVLAFGGSLLLGAAVVFFFAYNWDALHRFAKFGLAAGALAACTIVAMRARAHATTYRAALFGACVATGALLALIGQTYQTGADIWELFAAWAVLMLPFVVLSRSAASWLLWWVVANAALMRALSMSTWWGHVDALFRPTGLLSIAVLNFAILALFECCDRRLLAHPTRRLHRVCALGTLAPLTLAATLAWWERDFIMPALLFAPAIAAGGVIYLRLRRDLAILALIIFAAIAVGTAMLVKLLPVDNFFTLNLIGLIVIATSGYAGVWLTRLHRQAHRPDRTLEHTP